MSTERLPIRLNLANNKVAVWDIQDIQRLRVEHHISGVLSGTLPQVGQQNVFLGLPLLLMPEEVVLLLRNKLAVFCDNDLAHLPPTEEQSEVYHQNRVASALAQQMQTAKNEDSKRVKMNELYQDDILKRRKEKARIKLEKRSLDLDSSASTSTAAADSFTLVVPDLPNSSPSLPDHIPVPNLTSRTSLNPSNYSYQITIVPSSTPLPWFSPASSTIYETLEEAKMAGKWSYPTTPLEESRCKVFEDLWRRGFFMGIGLRFGGDFLIYPGDSLRYHSHFTLTVLTTPTTAILPLDIISYGRLATAVKKAHLLASYDAENDSVEYLSLEWSAFG